MTAVKTFNGNFGHQYLILGKLILNGNFLIIILHEMISKNLSEICDNEILRLYAYFLVM